MANIKADGTRESAEMVRIGIDEIEGHKSYASRDNEDLTRTGKKPVLKVRDNSPESSPPLLTSSTYVLKSVTSDSCQSWVSAALY